ncbi:MAG TPA: hypothetical protein VFQ78_14480 [Candidatus Udaeobacter sp.]|nr:hypothetical protein [Candidatus Udaeobacter sp.]
MTVGMIQLCVSPPEARADMERTLRDAAEAPHYRELRKAGVGENTLCLVIAIALEAIQQNFFQ